jgi:hypothetical protein
LQFSLPESKVLLATQEYLRCTLLRIKTVGKPAQRGTQQKGSQCYANHQAIKQIPPMNALSLLVMVFRSNGGSIVHCNYLEKLSLGNRLMTIE